MCLCKCLYVCMHFCCMGVWYKHTGVWADEWMCVLAKWAYCIISFFYLLYTHEMCFWWDVVPDWQSVCHSNPLVHYTTTLGYGNLNRPNFLRAFWGFSAIFSFWHKKYFSTQLLVKLIKLCIYSFSAKLMWPLFQKKLYWPWFTQKYIMPFTVSPSGPSHGYRQFINTKWSYIWGWFYSSMQ